MKHDRIMANRPIVEDIEGFCARTGMSVTAFGLGAINDRALVGQLRKGRRIWPETEARVRSFMAAHETGATQ